MGNRELKETELKTLFSLIENYKSNNKPISWAFRDYAESTNRRPNSIRNQYYLQLNILKTKPEIAQKIGIDLSKHEIQKATPFSSEEKEDVLTKINHLVNKGYSVRRACMALANGDASLMIRYQNKYRCMLNETKTENTNNVIKIPQRKTTISDADIQSLFLGLVKLVKKNALIEAKNEISNEPTNNLLISKYLNDIESKDKEITALRQQVSLISKSNQALTEQITCLKAKQKGFNTANEMLKSYIENKKVQSNNQEAKS